MLKLNKKSLKILKSEMKVLFKLNESEEEVMLNKDLFNILRNWRKDRAFKEGIKPYIIFSDSTLIQISNVVPKNKEELLGIRGMGEKKYEKFGEELLDIINDYKQKDIGGSQLIQVVSQNCNKGYNIIKVLY